MIVGKGLGIRHVERRSGDGTALERPDQGVGIDKGSPAHVHQPGRRLHGRERFRPERLPRLWSHGRREHGEVRLGEHVEQVGRRDRPFRSFERPARPIHSEDPGAEGFQHRNHRPAYPSRSVEKNRGAGQPPLGRTKTGLAPGRGPSVKGKTSSPCQGECKGMLCASRAVCAFGTGPYRTLRDGSRLYELLDTGERELHPLDLDAGQELAQSIGVSRVRPYESPSIIRLAQLSPAGSDRIEQSVLLERLHGHTKLRHSSGSCASCASLDPQVGHLTGSFGW
jgi:hypothetical protein